MNPTNRLPTYFISHGGGPWPWMKKEMGPTYDKLEAALADMPRQIGRTPRAFFTERFAVFETMARSGSIDLKPV